MLRSIRTPIIALSALTLTACAHVRTVSREVDGEIRTATEWFTTKRAHDNTQIVPVEGPVAIDVDSFSGSVTIRVNPSLTHATVTPTRYALHGAKRSDEAKLSLDEMSVDIDVRPGALGQELAITTMTTHAEAHFHAVGLEIEVPEVDGVTVRTRNGDVEVINAYGIIDISTDDGDVRFMTERPITSSVQIINNAGNIDFRVRGESMGAITAEAVRGEVVQNGRRGTWRILPGTSHNTLHASFNRGTNPITLRAADGDIRIAVVESPTSVGRWIID